MTRTPLAVLRATTDLPAALVSLVLIAALLGLLPSAGRTPALLVLLAGPAILATRHFEPIAVWVLWGARPANRAETTSLAAARAELERRSLSLGAIYIRHGRRTRAPLTEAVGRDSSLVVDAELLRAARDGEATGDQVAALLAHAIGQRRMLLPRGDIGVRVATAPWRALAPSIALVTTAVAGLPLLGLAWRLRGLVGVTCLVVVPSHGHVLAGLLGGAVVMLSHVVPAAHSELERRAQVAGDDFVVALGLGPALVDRLRLQAPGPDAERVRRLAVPADTKCRPHLRLVH